MKRLLHIIPYEHFYPPKTGGQLRCFHLMDELSNYFKLDVISFAKPEAIIDNGYSNKNVTFHNISDYNKNKTVFDLLPSRFATAIKYRVWQRTLKGPAERAFLDFYPVIKELMTLNKYDFVLFEHLTSMLLGQVCHRLSQTTIRIVDQHNVDHLLFEQTNDLSNKSKFNTFNRLKELESNLPKYCDYFLACSAQDKSQFDSLNNDQISGFVIANGAVIETDKIDLVKIKQKTLLFCGSLDYTPNINGLLWFYKEVWPLLLKKQPDIFLTIIGRNPNKQLIDTFKQENRIKFIGEVEDVVPYYNKNNIAIVPLKEGSGTRLKILEAMGNGNPVISTSIGAEGITISNGENIMIADMPVEFAEGINKLLEDSGYAYQLGTNALNYINSNYTWTSIVKTLFEQLKAT